MNQGDDELTQMATLVVLLESPALAEREDELAKRVEELVALGEEEIRRRGLAVRRRQRN